MAGVRVGLGAAEPVVHVERGDAVAQRAQGVPEAGRVGAAGDEARDRATGLDQLVRTDVPLDPIAQLPGRHRGIVTALLELH